MAFKFFSAFKYYASSIPTIIFGISNFYIIPVLFLKRPVTLRLRNHLLFKVVSFMEIWTLKEVCLDRAYEQFEEIKGGWQIIDIGASIGDFAVMNDRKAKRILSFEKDANRIERMKEHLRLNGCNKIKIFNETVSSLEDILKKNNVSKCDFLKMDCEGCEYSIINNASGEAFKKIDRIVMEYHLFDDEMKKSFLELRQKLECHYKIAIRPDPVHSYLGLLYAHR